MSKVNKLVVSGLLAGMLMVGPATVEAAEVTVGADAVSSYVWRGITLNKDTVIQPVIDVAHPSGVGVEIWGNFDLGDDNGVYEKREFSEIDLTLYYNHALEHVDLTVGYIEYTYPAQVWLAAGEDGDLQAVRATADRELFASVAKEVAPGFDMALTVYQSLASSDGSYAKLSGSYGVDVVDNVSVALNGSVAYTARAALNAPQKSGWHDYLVGVSADFAATEDVTLNAFVNYVGSLDRDVLPNDLIREDWFGGAGVYYSF